MLVLPFFLVYLLPLAVVVGYLLGGWFNFLTPVWAFVIIPLLDLWVGRNKINPTEEEERVFGDSLDYKLITWLTIPVQVALLFWAAHVVATEPLSLVALIGFTLSAGINGGALSINVAHELVHKHNAWEKTLGKILLWTVGYTHWWLEHVSGHHARVSTRLDPATARLGESFYRFWPRTVFGSFFSAWSIERRRLERAKKPVWGTSNRILRYIAATLLLAFALWLLWGWRAVAFYVAQSIVAFSLLEAVNYLEHYGLLRREITPGVYERVMPRHSWNASERVTNYFLFNLQRHSDHHAHPARRYQILRHAEEAPQLPSGYAAMVLLVIVPGLWFKIMDPKVPEDMKALALEARA